MSGTVTLQSDLSELLGKNVVRALTDGFGFSNLGDLLGHYPRRYGRRGELTPISEIPIGEEVTLIAEIVSTRERKMYRTRGSVVEVQISDGTGSVTLTFFNQPWRKKKLLKGAQGLFAGKIGTYQGNKQLSHPDYQLFHELDSASPSIGEEWSQKPIPIYAAMSSFPSWKIAKAIGKVLDEVAELPDPVPSEVIQDEGIMGFREALEKVHRPQKNTDWKDGLEALRFQEAFVLQTALAVGRKERLANRVQARLRTQMTERFIDSLPFSLTKDQEKAIEEIHTDLAIGHPMNRLLQGEVGSGKTVVAAASIVSVASSGGQTAFLAPTEVLANQHFRSIVEALGDDISNEIEPALLTGSTGSSDRKSLLASLAKGTSKLLVGTHALLSEDVFFSDLGLVVIDEQQRFGVDQRDALRQKGSNPHVLVLSATPIPRTVAMTVFGDLDISTIRTLPDGRAPIETHVVPLKEHESWYSRVWLRVGEELTAGRQGFVVTPKISKTRFEDYPTIFSTKDAAAGATVANVEEVLPMLRASTVLNEYLIEAVHGQIPRLERDMVMRRFEAGETDLLVATSIIEVGIDIENASIIVILDADRFGLSQLHQLRGRVGRGKHSGICLLVTHSEENSVARQRLEALEETSDGFELAALDLKLRSEGDILGASQSGRRSSLKLIRAAESVETIQSAKKHVERVLAADPFLSSFPSLKSAINIFSKTDGQNYLEKI